MLNWELQCWSELLGMGVHPARHLHGRCGVSAFAESLQDYESLWVKFGNCGPEEAEIGVGFLQRMEKQLAGRQPE